jgi:hypothetical protein
MFGCLVGVLLVSCWCLVGVLSVSESERMEVKEERSDGEWE